MSNEASELRSKRLIAADVEAIGRIGAVASILEMVCKSTGLRFAAVARMTADSWTACAVRDELSFGLVPGGELPIRTTLCDQVRDSREAVIIDHASEDPRYCGHLTPQMYRFESYISMPILRTNGEFFGTLCALDPKPNQLSDPKVVTMFQLFSQLIGLQLDAEERLQQSQAALLGEQQTADLREQFIAVLGHDLRNPLFSVTIGAETLARMPLDEKAAMIVQRIRRSGERMARLVDNILDFARGHLGGGLSIVRKPDSNLQQTLAHVMAELSAVNPGRQIDVDLDIGRPVSCDAGRIAQLFSNLLSNALMHGDPTGTVKVHADCDHDTFTLWVANQGTPIPQQTLDRLFMPFSRVAGDKRQQGLGLGLYIASQIAIAHCGRLAVDSQADETRFRLTMPASGT